MDRPPTDFVLKHIREMKPYIPGLQLNDPNIIKLNSNENPFPASKSVVRALQDEIQKETLQKYPDPLSSSLREAIATHYKQSPESVLVTNGSDEALTLLFRALLNKSSELVIPYPTYSLYPVLADLTDSCTVKFDLKEDWRINFDEMLNYLCEKNSDSNIDKPHTGLCIIANPNAPTGTAESKDDLLMFAKKNPAITLIDEAYIEFGGESVGTYAGKDAYQRMAVCSTFSKTYSLAGQRIGWLIAHPDLIAELNKLRDSYNVSRLSQAAALAAFSDRDELNRRIAVIVQNRKYLTESLSALGFETLPSHANFIFTKPPAIRRTHKDMARSYCEYLYANKILIRYFPNQRGEEFVRISIGSMPQMERLVERTSDFLKVIDTQS